VEDVVGLHRERAGEVGLDAVSRDAVRTAEDEAQAREGEADQGGGGVFDVRTAVDRGSVGRRDSG
jgi:hypothetical protein